MSRLTVESDYPGARASVHDGFGAPLHNDVALPLSVTLPEGLYRILVDFDGKRTCTMFHAHGQGRKTLCLAAPSRLSAAPLGPFSNYDEQAVQTVRQLISGCDSSGAVVLARHCPDVPDANIGPEPQWRITSWSTGARSRVVGEAGAVQLLPGLYGLETRTLGGLQSILLPVFAGFVTLVCTLGRSKPFLRSATLLTIPIGGEFVSSDPVLIASALSQDALRLGCGRLPLAASLALSRRVDPLLLAIALSFPDYPLATTGHDDHRRALAELCGTNHKLRLSALSNQPELCLEPPLVFARTLDALHHHYTAAERKPISREFASVVPALLAESHWTLWTPSSQIPGSCAKSRLRSRGLTPSQQSLLSLLQYQHREGQLRSISSTARDLGTLNEVVLLAGLDLLTRAARDPGRFLDELRDAGFDPHTATRDDGGSYFWTELLSESDHGMQAVIDCMTSAARKQSGHARMFVETLLTALRRDDSAISWEAANYTRPGYAIDPSDLFLFALKSKRRGGISQILDQRSAKSKWLVECAAGTWYRSQAEVQSVDALSVDTYVKTLELQGASS